MIVESRRALVAAVRFGNDDEAVVFDFHSLVFESELAAKLDAADFEPGEVISVVDDAHLVGFGVAHAHGGFGIGQVIGTA